MSGNDAEADPLDVLRGVHNIPAGVTLKEYALQLLPSNDFTEMKNVLVPYLAPFLHEPIDSKAVGVVIALVTFKLLSMKEEGIDVSTSYSFFHF